MDMSPLDNPTPSTERSYEYSYQDGPEITFNDDLYTAHAQLPTPDQSAFGKILAQPNFQTYQHVTEQCQPEALPAPHISPIGQANAMLYTPNSLADVDEGFEEMDFATGANLGNDFQLYPSTTKASNFDSLFGEVPSAGLGYSQQSQDMFSGQMDWSSGDYQGFNEHH
jgi:hypothetical protein